MKMVLGAMSTYLLGKLFTISNREIRAWMEYENVPLFVSKIKNIGLPLSPTLIHSC